MLQRADGALTDCCILPKRSIDVIGMLTEQALLRALQRPEFNIHGHICPVDIDVCSARSSNGAGFGVKLESGDLKSRAIVTPYRVEGDPWRWTWLHEVICRSRARCIV